MRDKGVCVREGDVCMCGRETYMCVREKYVCERKRVCVRARKRKKCACVREEINMRE